MRHALLALLAALLIAALLRTAAALDGPPEGQDAPGQAFRLFPAPPAEPALAHRLIVPAAAQTPGNAALDYLRMLSLGAPTVSPEQYQWLEAPLADLDLDRVEASLSLHADRLAMLADGAHRDHADFGRAVYREGIGTKLPHLNALRQSARLLALRIRLHIARGEFEPALNDLTAGFALARQLGQARTTHEMLAGQTVALLMLDQLELLLQQPRAPSLYWTLAELPRPLVDLRPALAVEADMLLFTIPEVRAFPPFAGPEDQAMSGARSARLLMVQALTLMRGRLGPQHAPDSEPARAAVAEWTSQAYPAARQGLADLGLSEEMLDSLDPMEVVVRHELHHYRRWRDEWFKWYGLPYWQGGPGLRRTAAAWQAHLRAGRPQAFAAFLPSFALPYRQQAELDRRLAVLLHVGALRQHLGETGWLPESLDEVALPLPQDPFTGQPFGYERVNDQTAVLTSPGDPAISQTGRRYLMQVVPPSNADED